MRRSMATTRWSSPLVAFGGEKEKKQRKKERKMAARGKKRKEEAARVLEEGPEAAL